MASPGCAPLLSTRAACGLGSGDVGDSGTYLIVVTPAALNTGVIWGMIDSPWGLLKYTSATLLTPSVLPAYTAAAALSPTLTDQNWMEFGAIMGTGVNGIPPR